MPMIDDLYDDRLAAIDGVCLAGGSALIVGAALFAVAGPPVLLGGVLVGVGVVVFVINILLVILRHSPHPIDRIVLGSISPRRTDGLDEAAEH